MKIGWAVLIVAMLALVVPRARRIFEETPKGSGQDWLSAIIPLVLVAAFVFLLMTMV